MMAMFASSPPQGIIFGDIHRLDGHVEDLVGPRWGGMTSTIYNEESRRHGVVGSWCREVTLSGVVVTSMSGTTKFMQIFLP
jgi:hypothetical protein